MLGLGWSTWVPVVQPLPLTVGFRGQEGEFPGDLSYAFSHWSLSVLPLYRHQKNHSNGPHLSSPSYRKTLLGPEEILLSIEIPYSREVRCCQYNLKSPLYCQAPDKEIWPRGPRLASLHFNTDVLVSEPGLY